MYGPIQFAGYLALVLTPVVLLGSALLSLPEPSLDTAVVRTTIGLQAVLVLAAAVAVVRERKRVVDGWHVDGPTAGSVALTLGFDEGDAVDALAVAAGGVVTYAISVAAGLGPVLASALVGLAVGLVAPRVAVPAYCGSFVGMASPAVFSLEGVALAGTVAGLGFVATAESFDGVGGKLGTIALCGCLGAVALTGLEYGSPSPPAWELVGVVVPVAVAGAVATVFLSLRLELGAVVGSGLVGVLAGVGFPLLLPGVGETLAAVAFCASFVGMSSAKRLSVGHVAVAGGVSGLVYLAVTPAVTGAGGKLGTIAFVSCIAVIGALACYKGTIERLR
ncbi:hypothetical protein D8Y22_07580 [Salinadaptatus halalkaliphilus]|uniref:Uncharacterized protein n=1 Tax=Salinadaptatus halalkaliphilus TaxID=2419781 RepID=A0A4S3TR76_9EURY|nr:hypothetical protein [Salinadaptatus halalkaliphilus]THE65078.1 hypothetical protein D8Y22_07580 [Salinadaptatus halalkaliphilus]